MNEKNVEVSINDKKPVKKAFMSNAESVEAYHKKLTDIRLRFPSAEVCGIDYAALIRDRAKKLGYIIERGKDKGEGSANAYILHLIEEDLGINMVKGLSQIDKDDEV